MNRKFTAPTPAQLTGSGMLRVTTFGAQETGPVPFVEVRIVGEGFDIVITTDEDGQAADIPIEAPPASLSLDINNTVQPYSTVSLFASAPNFLPVSIDDMQIFDGQITLANLEFTPTDETTTFGNIPNVTVTPPHSLFGPERGGSGLSPLQECVPRVLEQPIIPEYVTVHLGRPSAAARNVTVPFRQYIANVASSEIYPTWPEQALRANIHAQISLALNRIFTEWYPSKGFNFNITNSTSYDQFYVHGREIFEPMQRITNNIFNTYVRRIGTIDPFYTEYCDGKMVTCPGMKQWGTVTLANQGLNALQILQRYYGNNIEIVRTNNIQNIPQSYPGSPLTVGSTGTAVSTIQRQLNRIARNYPGLGTVTVDGVFGPATAAVVRRFQKQFSLAQDGVVGMATWYKISYIFVAVKKLAELSSEGVENTGNPIDGVYPGTSLRLGSTGAAVEQIQFWLSELARFNSNLQGVTVDGVFGPLTQNAVRTFQQQNNLVVDGVVGRDTWNAIFAQYKSIQDDQTQGANGAYPGTPLRQGDTGETVRQAQFYLRVTATNYSAIPIIAVDGIFGSGTANAVRAFQNYFGLSVDGVIGRATWTKLYDVYTSVVNDLLSPGQRPGTYPGTPLRQGSTGQAVREVQYYLFLLSAYYNTIPPIAFDGVFGPATTAAVRAYQTLFGLAVDGVVGPATWNSIYAQFQRLRLVDGPVEKYDLRRWPGIVFSAGDEGPNVEYIQFLLRYIAFYYDNVRTPDVTGIFDPETVDAVRSFQDAFGLPVTGQVDEDTWNGMVIIYLSLASGSPVNPLQPQNDPTEYPGFVLVLGSANEFVRQLQIFMNDVASRYCVADFVPETGIFDEVMQSGVMQFQAGFGLPVTGVVDMATWDAIVDVWRGDQNNVPTTPASGTTRVGGAPGCACR